MVETSPAGEVSVCFKKGRGGLEITGCKGLLGLSKEKGGFACGF